MVNQLNDCGLRITAPDKKMREQLIRSYVHESKQQLETLNDPPSELLAFIIAFIGVKTNSAVHASGKFVAPLIKQLADICSKDADPLPSEVTDKLTEAQSLVIRLIKKKGAEDDITERTRFKEILKNLEKQYLY